MSNLADEFQDISNRRREIRKEEGLGDDNWHTATGDDLDKVAAGYDLIRTSFENDDSLRKRIEVEATKWRKGSQL